jgi:hypothetical protein
MRKLSPKSVSRIESLSDMEGVSKEAAHEALVSLGWRQYLDCRVALTSPVMWARLKGDDQ